MPSLVVIFHFLSRVVKEKVGFKSLRTHFSLNFLPSFTKQVEGVFAFLDMTSWRASQLLRWVGGSP